MVAGAGAFESRDRGGLRESSVGKLMRGISILPAAGGRFITSFSQGTSGGPEMMVVPTNIVDRWMVRFEEKFQKDPSFMLKGGGGSGS